MYKFTFILLLFLSQSVSAQLVNSKVELWIKASEQNPKNTENCRKNDLLNFNCNIADNKFQKNISYQKNKSHSLIAVHTSKEGELVWVNKQNEVRLSNEKYQILKLKKDISLKNRASIYSYVSPAVVDKSILSDSINIAVNRQQKVY